MRRATLLLIAIALAGCTGSEPEDLDKDDDGAEDAAETEGLVITIDLLGGPQQRLVTSEPGTADTDGDGLLDGAELHVWSTDPRDVDTDDDRLLDGEDVPVELGRADEWRALGILEIEGLFLGEHDACPANGQKLSASNASSDRPVADELADGEEVAGWDVTIRGQARHVTSDPCRPDTDSDGLRDHEERASGTDPRAADTDADGAHDGVDVDPLNDLSLEFSDAAVDGGPDRFRIVLVFGASSAEIVWPGNGSAVVAVSDQTVDPSRLVTEGIVQIESEGRTLGGAILSIDLVQGTLSGAAVEGDRFSFQAENATISLKWSVLRR